MFYGSRPRPFFPDWLHITPDDYNDLDPKYVRIIRGLIPATKTTRLVDSLSQFRRFISKAQTTPRSAGFGTWRLRPFEKECLLVVLESLWTMYQKEFQGPDGYQKPATHTAAELVEHGATEFG